MTPIEQAKEALQEVSDTMDRKGGVAPIIRLDTLKKVNAALALLKTMEGLGEDDLEHIGQVYGPRFVAYTRRCAKCFS